MVLISLRFRQYSALAFAFRNRRMMEMQLFHWGNANSSRECYALAKPQDDLVGPGDGGFHFLGDLARRRLHRFKVGLLDLRGILRHDTGVGMRCFAARHDCCSEVVCRGSGRGRGRMVMMTTEVFSTIQIICRFGKAPRWVVSQSGVKVIIQIASRLTGAPFIFGLSAW